MSRFWAGLGSLAACFAWLIAASCSSNQNTVTADFFHNTTAHYNGYFYARDMGRVWRVAEAMETAREWGAPALVQRPGLDPMPQQWKQAGAEVAVEAAAGRLYRATEVGVTSKSVKADTVESSKTFAANYQQVTAGERLALALLKPWIGRGGVVFLKRA